MVSPAVPQPDLVGISLPYSRCGAASLSAVDSGMSESATKQITELVRWTNSSRLHEIEQIKWRREQICKREVGKIRVLLNAEQPQSYLYCTISTVHLMIINKAFRLLNT